MSVSTEMNTEPLRIVWRMLNNKAPDLLLYHFLKIANILNWRPNQQKWKLITSLSEHICPVYTHDSELLEVDAINEDSPIPN